MEHLHGIKAIAFDFDGTLADSNVVKRLAWRSVFTDRSEQHNEVLQRIVDAKVGDRFKILEETFIALKEPADSIQMLVERYAAVYEQLVQSDIFKSGLFPGTLEMLQKFTSRIPLYINSATPETPLIKIISALNIANYFKGIYGGPSTKIENLNRISLREGVSPSEILMVGDGFDDLSGARESGCVFVGIANQSNDWARGATQHSVISRVDELVNLL